MTTDGQSDDLLYDAWCVIANAHEGRWEDATPEWRAAAERWRDRWHETLSASTERESNPEVAQGFIASSSTEPPDPTT